MSILYDKNSFIKSYGLLTQSLQNPWLVPGSSKDFRFVAQTCKIRQKLHIYPFKAYDTLLESLKYIVSVFIISFPIFQVFQILIWTFS